MRKLISLFAGFLLIALGATGLTEAATKAKALLENPALFYLEQSYNILDNIQLAEAAFTRGLFVDTAYSSPSYLKEFFFKK